MILSRQPTDDRSGFSTTSLRCAKLIHKSPPAQPILFAPRPAIRVRRDEVQDTPLPPEIPAGKNPPQRRYLDYFLPTGKPTDVQLNIYSQDGKLIRAYFSAPLPEIHGQPLHIASYWITHPQPLDKGPGMHRFVWDLVIRNRKPDVRRRTTTLQLRLRRDSLRRASPLFCREPTKSD